MSPVVREVGSPHTRLIPGGASEPEAPALEAQQALLIGALRRAGGKPMSYAELREAGVELPASVVSELELAGVAIERCFGGGHGERRVVGVRLLEPEPETGPETPGDPDPPLDAGRKPQPVGAGPGPAPGWAPVRVYRASAPRALAESAWSSVAAAGAAAGHGARAVRAGNARLLAPLALGAAVVIVAVVLLTGLSGGGAVRSGTAAAARRPRAGRQLASATPARTVTTTTTASTTPASTATTTTSATSAPPTPTSPALATQLESQGHAMLDSGQYAGAISVLHRAVTATGEQANGCVEPDSTACLTYAYALYDLGRALRLSGNSAAAVPILEARLQIDNQRSTVAAELQLARQQAG